MSAQSDTSARLIDFIGQQITNEIEIDGQKLSVQAKQREFPKLPTKSPFFCTKWKNYLTTEAISKKQFIMKWKR